MLEMSQLTALFKHLFTSKDYGNTLKEYIVKHNPKTTSDIEMLERRWLYRQNNHTGGGQWL